MKNQITGTYNLNCLIVPSQGVQELVLSWQLLTKKMLLLVKV